MHNNPELSSPFYIFKYRIHVCSRNVDNVNYNYFCMRSIRKKNYCLHIFESWEREKEKGIDGNSETILNNRLIERGKPISISCYAPAKGRRKGFLRGCVLKMSAQNLCSDDTYRTIFLSNGYYTIKILSRL